MLPPPPHTMTFSLYYRGQCKPWLAASIPSIAMMGLPGCLQMPTDENRRAEASAALNVRAALVEVRGDWTIYKEALPFPAEEEIKVEELQGQACSSE